VFAQGDGDAGQGSFTGESATFGLGKQATRDPGNARCLGLRKPKQGTPFPQDQRRHDDWIFVTPDHRLIRMHAIVLKVEDLRFG
jgi:hypothetical protein